MLTPKWVNTDDTRVTPEFRYDLGHDAFVLIGDRAEYEAFFGTTFDAYAVVSALACV